LTAPDNCGYSYGIEANNTSQGEAKMFQVQVGHKWYEFQSLENVPSTMCGLVYSGGKMIGEVELGRFRRELTLEERLEARKHSAI
jgi:hypothetical protein